MCLDVHTCVSEQLDRHWSALTQDFFPFASLQIGFFGFVHSLLVPHRSTSSVVIGKTQDFILVAAKVLHISPFSVSQSLLSVHCCSSRHLCWSLHSSSKAHLELHCSCLTQSLFPSASLHTLLFPCPRQSRFFVHWSLLGFEHWGLKTQTWCPLGMNSRHSSQLSQSESESHSNGSWQRLFESRYSVDAQELPSSGTHTFLPCFSLQTTFGDFLAQSRFDPHSSMAGGGGPGFLIQVLGPSVTKLLHTSSPLQSSSELQTRDITHLWC